MAQLSRKEQTAQDSPKRTVIDLLFIIPNILSDATTPDVIPNGSAIAMLDGHREGARGGRK